MTEPQPLVQFWSQAQIKWKGYSTSSWGSSVKPVPSSVQKLLRKFKTLLKRSQFHAGVTVVQPASDATAIPSWGVYPESRQAVL